MHLSLWQECLQKLETELAPQEYNTWIRPLQAEADDKGFTLYSPNRFVLEWINEKYLDLISSTLEETGGKDKIVLTMKVGSTTKPVSNNNADQANQTETTIKPQVSGSKSTASYQQAKISQFAPIKANLNRAFSFSTFVEGKSNQIAKAACAQVAENPGTAYNPLFIYGSVGLGKTHLMHAIGNLILENKPQAKVRYLHSERFVGDMVKALQTNKIDDFKQYYRTVDALLIDDIQFFAGKDRSQEEFFHTFNALLEGQQQVILTCDRYPKEIAGLEDRLGLTVAIEPPDLETRVASLMNKAEEAKIALPNEVAFFIAKRIRSNVRELEGVLKRVIANAHFTGKAIDLLFVKEVLKDLISLQEKLVTIDNIQKTVAEYYKIKVSDLLSRRRSRSIVRPRQMAMALSKELTNHSLPEIGDAFGGKDHTTVLHACQKIEELRESTSDIKEDYTNLIRVLSN